MKNTVASIVVGIALLSFSGQGVASVFRIDCNKANQTKSAGLNYSITLQKSHGLVIVDFKIPHSQKLLEHLWRIDVVLIDKKKTLMAAPLETKRDKRGNLVAQISVHPESLKHIEIQIRTGKHAPLAETVFAIDVDSYK